MLYCGDYRPYFTIHDSEVLFDLQYALAFHPCQYFVVSAAVSAAAADAAAANDADADAKSGKEYPARQLSPPPQHHPRLHKPFLSQTCQRLATSVPRPLHLTPSLVLHGAGVQRPHVTRLTLLYRLCVGNGAGSECAQVLLLLPLMLMLLHDDDGLFVTGSRLQSVYPNRT